MATPLALLVGDGEVADPKSTISPIVCHVFARGNQRLIGHEATHLTASDWDELQHTVLYQHPAVAEAGVIGIPDETGGEVVVAYVAKKEGVSATEAESIEFAKKQIAVHKVPEKVFFLPSLPKSAVGKVQRRALKEHYRSAHA